MHILQSIFAAMVGFWALVFPHNEAPANVQIPSQLLGATNPVAGTYYSLAGSGITGSASSITLNSLTIPQTGYELLDADFSTTFYITLEPGSRTQQELASCTTVTQNADNTATLSGCTRGLLPYTPFTSSSTYQFAHGGGTYVIFSNPPQFYQEFAAQNNNATITAVWRFNSSTLPIVSADTANSQVSVATNTLATVNYVNSVASSGAADASQIVKGLVEAATIAETAAGTATGTDTGALLFPQNKYFNASSSATTTVVVTNSSGKIDLGFINQTTNYNWTGSNTLASTTFSATTTLNANLVGAGYIPTLASGMASSTLDFVTSSASSFVTIGSSTSAGIASTTITLVASHKVLITFTGSMTLSANLAMLDFSIDGTSVSGGLGLTRADIVGASNMSATFVTSVQTAGAHTFRALLKTGAAAVTVYGGTGGLPIWTFSATELYN